jgi:hypothetical protein
VRPRRARNDMRRIRQQRGFKLNIAAEHF